MCGGVVSRLAESTVVWCGVLSHSMCDVVWCVVSFRLVLRRGTRESP